MQERRVGAEKGCRVGVSSTDNLESYFKRQPEIEVKMNDNIFISLNIKHSQ